MIPYLHDDQEVLRNQTASVLEMTQRLGFIPNWEKSQLVPTQRITHLDRGRMFPPLDRVDKVERGMLFLLGTEVATALFWVSLLELLNSTTNVIPLGRLFLRPPQFDLLAHWRPGSRDMGSVIPIDHELLDYHLRW